jgi:Mn-containing catalase
VDLHSGVAFEARPKIVYDRLINDSNDPGASDGLTLRMPREATRQKMFEAALAAITENSPLGRLAGDRALGRLCVEDFWDGGRGPDPRGQFAQASGE